jgi:hypothetical protein
MIDARIERFTLSPPTVDNTSNPLSFNQWIKQNYGVIPNSEYEQYQKYLWEWYNQKESSSSAEIKIRQNYLQLVERMRVVIEDDPDFDRISKLNIYDTDDLRLLIPKISKKLCEIADYYNSKRDDIRNAKLQYNRIGTIPSLQKTLHDYFVQRLLNESTSDVFNRIKEENEDIAAVIDQLDIQVIEKVVGEQTITEDIKIFSSNPLFDLLESALASVGDSPAQLVDYFNPADTQLLPELWEPIFKRSIGANYRYNIGLKEDAVLYQGNLPLLQGHNFFYFYKGQFEHTSPYKEESKATFFINSVDWTEWGATGGNSMREADIVFYQEADKIIAAWLADNPIQVSHETLHASLYDRRYFYFPYPGKGDFDVNGLYTGPSITDENNFPKNFYPVDPQENQKGELLTEEYWKWTVEDNVKTDPLHIQHTSIINDGAYADTNFQFADKIVLRNPTQTDNSEVYSDNEEVLWAFDFNKTDIPIDTGENLIQWPIQKITIPPQFVYTHGDDVPLNDIPNKSYVGAVAGLTPSTADKIFKYQVDGTTRTITDGAWLKGWDLAKTNPDGICDCEDGKLYAGDHFVYGSTQPGLSLRVNPNQTVPFVWMGNTIPINDVSGFRGFYDDVACELDSTQLQTIISKQEDINCPARYYSPLGHRGNNIEEYQAKCDIILKNVRGETFTTIEQWRGSDGKDYLHSRDAAWFKLTENGVDVGWGKGTWQTATNENFEFEFAREYFYYRNTINTNTSNPYLILHHCYCEMEGRVKCLPENWKPRWHKLIFQNGQWVDGGQLSDMVLRSGNFIQYEHQESFEYAMQYYSLVEESVPINALPQPIRRDRRIDSLSFILSVELENTMPYWGISQYHNPREKAHDAGNVRNHHSPHDYLILTNPLPSNRILEDGQYMEYIRSDCAPSPCFVWEEPIIQRKKINTKGWKKIDLSQCHDSEILDHLSNDICCLPWSNDVVFQPCSDLDICVCLGNKERGEVSYIKATLEDSDVLFRSAVMGSPTKIHYFARRPFTIQWNINLNRRRETEDQNGVFVEALTPWRNLIQPWTPQLIIAHSKDQLKDIHTHWLYINNTSPTRLYTGHTIFTLDIKNTTQTYREGYEEDGNKVLASSALYLKDIAGISPYPVSNKQQLFIPYVSEYEQNPQNVRGLYSPQKANHPWTGDTLTTWGGTVTPNYRNEVPVFCGPNAWYNNQLGLPEDTHLYKYAIDIYGQEFFLFKTPIDGIYNQSQEPGILFIKNEDKVELFDEEVLDIEVIYDLLVIRKFNEIIIYDKGMVRKKWDYGNEENDGFVGYWFDAERNHFFVAYMTLTNDVVHINVERFSVDTKKTTHIYPNMDELVNWEDNAEWNIGGAITQSGKELHVSWIMNSLIHTMIIKNGGPSNITRIIDVDASNHVLLHALSTASYKYMIFENQDILNTINVIRFSGTPPAIEETTINALYLDGEALYLEEFEMTLN